MLAASPSRYDGNLRIIGLFRLVIATLFVAAACGKIAAPAEFAESVANYRMLPERLVTPVAFLLPMLELLAGLLLLVPKWRGPASAWLIVLVTAFIAAQSQALFRGLDITCGCFLSGTLGRVSFTKLAGNLILLFGLVLVWRCDLAKLKDNGLAEDGGNGEKPSLQHASVHSDYLE